ncbi:MAG: hypothetical protein ACRC2B_12385 [Rubrivivax sp.]
MSIIFRKTAKGVAEIETRANRLSPRVRNALILVNGQRDVAALKGLMPQQVDESLATLLEQSLIEVVGASVTDSGPQHALPDEAVKTLGRPPADVKAATSHAPQASTTSGPSFTTRQRTAVRALHDAIGPSAESLAIRMERARNEAELRPLLQMAVQVIGDARGRSAAEAYATRHGF